MSVKLNLWVLLSIAALLGGCGGGGDADQPAAGQAAPSSSAPASSQDVNTQRSN